MDDLRHESRLRQLELMGRLRPSYEARMEDLQSRVYPGYRFPWRVAEAPALVPEAVFNEDLAALRGLLEHYFTRDFRADHRGHAPDRFRRPDESGWFPRFIATDYQRVWDEGAGRYRLCCPEIQSFPGNMMLKPTMLSSCLQDLSEFEEADCFLDEGIGSWEEYLGFFRSHVLRDHSAADTVILEIAPQKQATFVDMLLSARALGCRVVALEDVEIDEVSGEVSYRKAVEFSGESPKLIELSKPQRATNILSRCLPDELDEALEAGAISHDKLRRLLQGTLERGVADWVVHPQDFFVLSKATLVGNPQHHPPLRPLDDRLLSSLARDGLALEQGVIKPAFAAGGRGLVGLTEDGVDRAALIQREILRAPGADPMTLLFWQEKYGADTFERTAIPGFAPSAPDEADPLYHELRVMWAARGHGPEGAVELTPLCGLTRWSRSGFPANARHQKTPFTGTQGIFVAR